MIDQVSQGLNLSSSFSNFPESWNFSKGKIALIVCFSLACLAFAYGIYRRIQFKAKHASTSAQKSFPELVQQNDEKLKAGFAKVAPTSLKESTLDLQKGYAVIPFCPQEEMGQRFEELKCFDSRPENEKKQFSATEVEYGYAQLKGKNVFVVRNQQVPEELKNFIPYIQTTHTLAMNILIDIEKNLCLDPGTITAAVSKNPLPEVGKATSLLRLFAYDPSTDGGHAADSHEDLGLLTIIPRSPVPALEVIDYQDNVEWINLESTLNPSQAIVLVGATLEKLTHGKYLAAPHRVKKSALKRFSIVYQLRAEPQTKIRHQNQEITVEEWLTKLKANLTSVNGSY